MISTLSHRTPELEARFWAKVQKTSTCWNWTASRSGKGKYGQFFVFKKNGRPYMALAHRAAYELLIGPIPEGMTLDHLCKNTICVNPAHLEVVTRGENARRGLPKNAKKTLCPKGHPYDRVDTWFDKRSGKQVFARRCDRCRKESERR